MQEHLHHTKKASAARENAVRVRRSFSSFAGTAKAKRILYCFLCFLTALLFAGTAAFPGVYPFGIAVIAAAGGILPAAASAIGAVCGSVRIPSVGGIYCLTFVGLFLVRAVLSVLASDAERERRTEQENRTGIRNRLSVLLSRFIARVKQFLPEEDAEDRYGSDFGVSARRTPVGSVGDTPSRADRMPARRKAANGTVLREHIRIRMALSACAALFAGAWSVVAGGYEYTDLFGAVFSVLMTPVAAFLFYAASEKNMRASPFREFGVYALLMTAALSLHLVSSRLFGLSLPAGAAGEGAVLRRKTLFDAGIFFSLCASLVAGRNEGWHRGAVAGVLCGLTMDPVLVPMYVLSAVTYAVLERLPAVFPVLGAGAAAVSWSIFTEGINGFTAVVPPAAVMCALLIPLFRYDLAKTPDDLFGIAPLFPGREKNRTSRAYAEKVLPLSLESKTMSDRVKGLSEGLSSVSAVLSALSERLTKPTLAEIRGIAEECVLSRCSRCSRRSECRGQSGKNPKTDALIRSMADALYRDGFVSAAVVPPSLAARCAEMGEILDESNRSLGERICALSRDNRLSQSAYDWELAGELFRHAEECGKEASLPDGAAEKKLNRLLSPNGFTAQSVRVFGSRTKYIFAFGVDLLSTRLGGDDIRRLFEQILKIPLSMPDFEVDGPALSMRIRSVSRYFCRTGSYSCAASGVQRYWGDQRSRGAYSGESLPCESGKDPTAGSVRERKDASAENDGRKRLQVSDSEPDDICGDMITDFEADGRYYMILSDGMGSGREAALTSGITVSLLERLIRSGAGMETSLKLLNQIIRSTGRECSSTVDIAEIDLTTGEARFIKSGAAPSFVLRDGSIFRLQSKTVPIGILRALDAEMIRFEVREGDTVVMVSDGAARSYDEDPWLLDLLTSDGTILEGDEKTAAMTVVSEAAVRGSSDDITCGVMRIQRKAG
jgi:serine/threonine protein phosphatase PrpC